MTGLDTILKEEMILEDTEEIMHMDCDTDMIDGFYPSEDEDFCNAVLHDELDTKITKHTNYQNTMDKEISDEEEDTSNDI